MRFHLLVMHINHFPTYPIPLQRLKLHSDAATPDRQGKMVTPIRIQRASRKHQTSHTISGFLLQIPLGTIQRCLPKHYHTNCVMCAIWVFLCATPISP